MNIIQKLRDYLEDNKDNPVVKILSALLKSEFFIAVTAVIITSFLTTCYVNVDQHEKNKKLLDIQYHDNAKLLEAQHVKNKELLIDQHKQNTKLLNAQHFNAIESNRIDKFSSDFDSLVFEYIDLFFEYEQGVSKYFQSSTFGPDNRPDNSFHTRIPSSLRLVRSKLIILAENCGSYTNPSPDDKESIDYEDKILHIFSPLTGRPPVEDNKKATEGIIHEINTSIFPMGEPLLLDLNNGLGPRFYQFGRLDYRPTDADKTRERVSLDRGIYWQPRKYCIKKMHENITSELTALKYDLINQLKENANAEFQSLTSTSD